MYVGTDVAVSVFAARAGGVSVGLGVYVGYGVWVGSGVYVGRGAGVGGSDAATGGGVSSPQANRPMMAASIDATATLPIFPVGYCNQDSPYWESSGS